ncbi:MAG: HAMP domain-containing histidine kinase [Actinobacteria bacterium]|nr:HAMP domain-containing histidine kinase [Actinomycetota bacterium]
MRRWRSIRFRLSVQYSAVVFGIGGGLLGLVYLAVQSQLRSQTMTANLLTRQEVVLDSGQVVFLPRLAEVEVRAIESIFNEIVLNEVARFTVIALGILFLLSLAVGWVMSGRVLRPVEEITNVAREIQASDLSRRIALTGPDDELKRLADTFDEMLDRLDRAFRSQRQFLADTSHDLRTPLTVIRSNVELVADDPEAGVDDWRRAGGIIRRNAERMSRMIEDLLAAARLQAGRAQAVSIDLAALVREKVEEYRPIAADNDVMMVATGGSAMIQGVEVSLDRALSNLVENACRVAPPGSTITLGSGTQDGWAWLAVADEGPGLEDPPEATIGLGLSIVNQVAEMHGGVLVTDSSADRGTRMVIWLPGPEAAPNPPDVLPIG